MSQQSNKLAIQPTNQLMSQPTTNEPRQAINEPGIQVMSQLINYWINKRTNEPASKLRRSASQPVKPANQPVKQAVYKPTTNCSTKQIKKKRNQSVSQPTT